MPATEQIWRPLPTMHRVFAASAIVLLAATLLMMAKDEKRDWRAYQRKADNLKVDQLARQLAPYSTEEFHKKEQALEKAVADENEKLQDPKTQEQLKSLETRRSKLQSQIDLLSRVSKFQNAERDVKRANLDLVVRDEKSPEVIRNSLSQFSTESDKATEKVATLQAVQAELRDVKDQITQIYAPRDLAEGELKKFRAERTRLEEQLALVSPAHVLLPEAKRNSFAAIKRSFKELPIINGFNPHHKIEYEWPRELQIQLGMARVARTDRCRTCHLNINDFATGNVASYPDDEYHQPFSSHPHPELFLTSASPHPIDKFGCTICHEGDGSGTSFQTAEHTPADPGQAEHWSEEFGWHSNHFWEYPMLPKQFVESSCLRCHHNVVELGINRKYGPTAPKVFEGYELIKTFGCFGCHEINGYDGAKPIGPDIRLEPQTPEELAAYAADPNAVPGTMRKVGPSLRHIASKTTPDFVTYWTEDPQRFRPSTRMPKFFNLDNQHDALAGVLQPVELASIAKYLMDKSEPMTLQSPAEGYQPDAERGKIAFERRGCLACHSYTGEEFAGAKADFGPNLSNIHEKIKPGPEGFNWLYTWLKNPEAYHTRTRMPNLFLTPETVGGESVDPAADIAAFLLQGGPKEFPKTTPAGPSLGIALDTDFTAAEAQTLRLPEHAGVRVVEVLQTGPASRALTVDAAGKPPVNSKGEPLSLAERLAPIKPDDVILAFNGTPVGSVEQLARLTSEAGNNARAVLKLVTSGLERMVEVQISTPLEDMTRMYLLKSLSMADVDKAMAERRFPVPAHAYQDKPDGTKWNLTEFVKGDEIELAATSPDEKVDEATWKERQLNYIGRRTIARYGCYGCHDIANFESAKPIGTALQDWGRKDTSKLALEHIEEFLHHHGQPNGSSTTDYIKGIVERSIHDKDVPEVQRTEAYFYESLQHHGRAGFLWQKLRAPRSYDYRKIESKGWDERLRMPKFPFSESQIEAVATFVLGLVNDPPPPAYQYRPTGAAYDVIEGERLMDKYNCTGCHVIEMPSLTYKANLAETIGASRDQIVDWFQKNATKIESGEITQEALTGSGPADAVLPEEMRAPLATFLKNSEVLLVGQLDPSINLKTDLAKHLAGLARRSSGLPFKQFLDQHQEVLLADAFDPADHPDALRLLLKLKPPVAGMAAKTAEDGRALITAHGLITARPDPEEEDPEFRQFGLDIWETLGIAGRIRLPSSKVAVKEADVAATTNGRGGDFAHWLVPKLNEELNDINKSWQASPPPLYKEGIKVQTPWLFRFLKNPEQLRYTTVLRMPRFNMSDQEAQSLANYFAAVDNVEYPYQTIPHTEPAYLTSADAGFHSAYPNATDGFQMEAWKVLNGPLCAKCHQVGGRPYVSTDPKDVRGPNLERVEKRLQSDWTRTWVYKPTWFTPYTSMPVNFPANKPPFPDLFGGNSDEQVEAVVYSLMNYSRLLEALGMVTYAPPMPPAETPPADAPAAGGEE